MAAVVAGPLAAGGEEAAAAVSVPGSPGLPGSRSAERALEEAVATGTLNLSNRRLKHFPRGAARSYDLSDITQAGELRRCPRRGGGDPHGTATLICIAPPRARSGPTPPPGTGGGSSPGVGTEPATSPPRRGRTTAQRVGFQRAHTTPGRALPFICTLRTCSAVPPLTWLLLQS